MSKKNKNKPDIGKDHTIDSIIEETRYLSEQEKMAKEAAKLSSGPKMEEIYSNTSKEIRLTTQSPLDAVPDEEIETAPAPAEETDIAACPWTGGRRGVGCAGSDRSAVRRAVCGRREKLAG